MITTNNREALLEKARDHVRQAAAIVQRLNLTNKYAAIKLAEADQNLAYPEPVVLGALPEGGLEAIDVDNFYVTLNDACKVTGWSRTTIRKLVQSKVLPQEHRGLYRFKDLTLCVSEYFAYGTGKEFMS